MGEFAIYNGARIKIGVCESMYYLRYEDRYKVTPVQNSVNPAEEKNLFWRLPFPDEDNIQCGHYKGAFRGVLLYDPYTCTAYSPQAAANAPGTIQLRHECGLLLNVPCYHGIKLPDATPPVRVFWNGQSPAFFELTALKNTEQGLFPVVRCRYCNEMWTCGWEDVLPYVMDEELRRRLLRYKDAAQDL